MYKQRFHQWDFRKNLKAGEVKKFKGLTASGQATHLPVVHGRKLGSKRLKSLVTKSNSVVSRPSGSGGHLPSPSSTVSSLSSPPRRQNSLLESVSSRGSPLPGLINAPDDFRLVDLSLRAVTAYSAARLENGMWNLSDSSIEVGSIHYWSTGMDLVAAKITEKRDLMANFQILNHYCDEYRIIIRREDPLLVWATYNAVLQLSQIGGDIAMSFIKLAAGLSSIHFGQFHPMTILWNNLRRMNMQGIRRAALPIIDAQFKLIHDNGRVGNAFWPRYHINMAKKLHDLGLLSPEATYEKLNYTLNWIEENPGSDRTLAEYKLNNTRLILACIYIDCKEYVQASSVLDKVENWIKEGGLACGNQLVNCTEIRAEICDKTGDYEKSERHYQKALEMAQNLLWEKDPGRIGFSFTALEKFYLDHGRFKAAEAVRDGYNVHLQSMVGTPSSAGNTLLEDVGEEDHSGDSELE